MIQRIQTIFLLLSAAASGSLFVLPMAVAKQAVANSFYLADGKVMAEEFPLGLFFVAAGLLLHLVAIFLFRNRNLQGRIALLGASILGVLGIVTGGRWWLEALPSGNSLLPHWGTLALALGCLFSVLAQLGIARDEKIVRSMDRLR